MLDRIRTLTRAQLSARLVVCEQIRAMGEALQASSVPAFYVLDHQGVPQHEFAVWRGTETMTDEIRAALAIGFWPAPPETPSPQKLMSQPDLERFVAVTLYGGAQKTPWEPLWRERGVRHGLYGVFLSKRGRMGVMLVSRADQDPPFTDADLAFAKACAPYVEASLDMETPAMDVAMTPADAAYLRFSDDGGVTAMTFGAREILRDAAGGGPGSVQATIAMIEQINRAHLGVTQLDQSIQASLTLAGSETERAFRTSMFEIAARAAHDPDRVGVQVVLAQQDTGRYMLRLSTLIGLDGSLERIGIVTRYVPPLLLQVRGAFKAQASAREIQLLCALNTHDSLKAAADALNIAKPTARTLGNRLSARVHAETLPDAIARLGEIGRQDWRTNP